MLAKSEKPAKPSPDFPLFAHGSGQWAKKIKGKMRYFGHWDDPNAALDKYDALMDADGGQRVQTPTTTTVTKAPIKAKVSEKPKRPHKDYPLFAHDNGQWAKQVRGRLHYFGPWNDPNGALDRWIAAKDDLLAGRQHVEARTDQVTTDELVNRYLLAKRRKLEAQEIGQRSYDGYKRDGERLLAFFGRTLAVENITPEQWGEFRAHLATQLGPVAMLGAVNGTRMIVKYGVKNLDLKEPKYGDNFDRPSQKTLRVARKEKGKRLLTPKQLWGLIDAADAQLRAMILLGVNCGFGNNDCATIRKEHLDLASGTHTYWRPKTGVDRGAPLWPETIQALKVVLGGRQQLPKNPADEGLVFLTRCGNSWTKYQSAVTHAFNDLLEKVKIKRLGFSFYSLRHVFATVGHKSRDSHAVEFIMGHAPSSRDMVAVYTEELDMERLRHVTDYVRNWLYEGTPGKRQPTLSVHKPDESGDAGLREAS